jgi:hypothetical protein
MESKDSAPNEDEIRRAAETKEWIENRISELESELDHLKELAKIVDSILRKASFVPAANLRQSLPRPEVEPVKGSQFETGSRKELGAQEVSALEARRTGGGESSRALRRAKDGLLLANAYITPNRIDIVPASDVKLSPTTPPFESFFINRILKGYENKDQQDGQLGKLPKDQILRYEIEQKDGLIAKISVYNYRDNSRLNEIISTATWAFTRMLEKK